MADDDRQALTAAIRDAPIGVVLLALIEHGAAGRRHWPAPPSGADSGRIEEAVRFVDSLEYPELLWWIEEAASLIGPWRSEALRAVASAYADAPLRLPMARAISDRFGHLLEAEFDLRSQEWWTDSVDFGNHRFFTGFDNIYCGGAFTFGGLWTMTSPPPEIHEHFVESWDFIAEPIRWAMPIDSEPRTLVINRPDDWAELVARFPARSPHHHEGWEMPGLNQTRKGLAPLLAVGGQHAGSLRERYLAPEWAAVAEDYDAVHLSWAGFLTAEGFVTELDHEQAAMLRYWGSERTLWLHDVFGEPEPLPSPECVGAPDSIGVALSSSQSALLAAMGRPPTPVP